MTGRIKQANKDRELEELAFSVLLSFRHQGAMQWVDWYETSAARRGRGLSTRTFSAVVKKLMVNGQVQKDKDNCYRAVCGTVDADVVNTTDVRIIADSGIDTLADTKNFPAVETDQFRKALWKAGNGNADIADIALRQLMDREVQDS